MTVLKRKPCPLCAGKAVAVKYVRCMLVLKDMHTSEEAVVNAWNKRPT